MTRDEVIERCCTFIRSIGIEIEERIIEGTTFVPGIAIDKGHLIVDVSKMKYPGDLLHEAGHIAVVTPDERPSMNGDATGGKKENQGQELGVLLWSFFAAQEAGVPLQTVFHPDGYKGDSEWLIENFTNKKYIGLPLLEWMKIVKRNAAREVEIISWLRER
jgi:hypothetical protein